VPDSAFMLNLIRQSSYNTVHGGLGDALMALFALGLSLIFVLNEISFLILYFKLQFTAVRIMC
jgi:hypothetical protein